MSSLRSELTHMSPLLSAWKSCPPRNIAPRELFQTALEITMGEPIVVPSNGIASSALPLTLKIVVGSDGLFGRVIVFDESGRNLNLG